MFIKELFKNLGFNIRSYQTLDNSNKGWPLDKKSVTIFCKKKIDTCHNYNLGTLVLVVQKGYIVIFSTTKYQNVAILVEPKPYFLAPQLRCTATFVYAL